MVKNIKKAAAWLSVMGMLLSEAGSLYAPVALAADTEEIISADEVFAGVVDTAEQAEAGRIYKAGYILSDEEKEITATGADVSYREAMAELVSSPEDASEEEIVRQVKLDKQFPATEDWFAYFDENYPATRDQGEYATCWAHTAMSLAEFYMINKGKADKSVDYSDLHMTYWTYTQGTSSQSAGDTRDKVLFSPVSENGIYSILDNGGSLKFAAESLMRGRGVAAESVIPYTWAANIAGGGSLGAPSERNDVVYLKDACLISIRFNEEMVKEAIVENGAVGISMYADRAYYDPEHNSYFCTDSESSNHALTIVGWDDYFPAENFKECNGKLPPWEGAWLARNSYSDENSESYESYFWISYYDSTISGAWAYQMMDSFPWENHYYYDSQLHGNAYYTEDTQVCEYANVFTANGEAEAEGERLEAVSFEMALVRNEGSRYTVKIYGGLEGDTPDTGTLIRSATTEGTVYYEGVYTVSLNSPVILDKGEKFAVVISFDKPGSSVVIERAVYDYNGISSKVGIDEGQSFVSTDREEWADVKSGDKDSGNLVIAAMTSNTEKKAVVSRLELKPSVVTFTGAGEEKKLSLKLLDSNGEEAADSEYSYVSFESLNSSVAVVDNLGNITAVANGRAKVVARYNGLSAECDVNVVIPDEGYTAVPVANIKDGSDIDWAEDKLEFTCSTPGAVIYYTLDGSNVTAGSTSYNAPISFSASMAGNKVNVKAMALAKGLQPSETVSLNFIVPAKGKIKLSSKGTVIKSTEPGDVTVTAKLLLGDEEEKPKAGFRWSVEDEDILTLNAGNAGRDATARLTGLKNGVTKVSVSANNAFGERLYADISISVDIATTGEVHIAPVSVNYLYAGENISLSCDTAGANIYYHMEVAGVSTDSIVYSEPVVITSDMVGSRICVKAYAVKEGLYPSDTVSADFAIKRGKPGKSAYDPQPDQPQEDGYIFLVKGQSFYVDPSVNWETGSKKVITVDKKGLVRAKSAGGARLSSKDDPDNYMDFIVAVPSVKVSSKTLACGDEAFIELNCFVNGTDVSGRFKTYLWESSNDEVATVDENGNITAVGKGSAVIRAYINGKAFGTKISVKDQVDPGKLKILDNTVSLTINPLQNTVLKIDGINMKKCGFEGEWTDTSSDKKGNINCYENDVIRLHKGGRIEAKAAGACSFRLIPDGNAKKAIDVEVTVREATERVVYLQPGAKRTISIKGVKNSGKDAALWSSSDEDVALVVKGKINARTEGECLLSCEYKGFVFKIWVYVCSCDLKTDEKLRLNGKNYELTLNAEDEPYEINWVNHPYENLVFTNKNNNVVFTDQYEVIYIRGKGKTVITADVHGIKIKIKVLVQ